jgi:hypothetical protein
MMAKKPSERYRTPGMVAAALQPFSGPDNRSSQRCNTPLPQAVSVSNPGKESALSLIGEFGPLPEMIVASAPAADMPREPATQRARGRRSGRWLWVAAASASALLAGAAVVLLEANPRITGAGASEALVQSPTGDDTSDKLGSWVPLFNGQDLQGWETWLAQAPGTQDVRGHNQDPRSVFSVVGDNGQPAIRISGEVFGALTTQKEFSDYHLHLEFKWGRSMGPPHEHPGRQSGLLYHAVDAPQPGRFFWMNALECEIAEGKSGGLAFPADSNLSLETQGLLVRLGPPGQSMPVVRYNKTGRAFTVPVAVPPRILRAGNHEKPAGEWNTLEVLTLGGTSIHRVNGQLTLVATEARRWFGLRPEPFHKGKIQLKSAGSEIFFRNLALRRIDRIPEEYR